MAGTICHIAVEEAGWKKALPNYESRINLAVEAVSKQAMLSGDISVLLTNNKDIQALNRQYRGKDKPTNVLSFPQNEPLLLGDVALALEILQSEAREQGKVFSDHFTHLFVHGVLHLLGHDHEKATEQKTMEALEIKILASLNISNPY